MENEVCQWISCRALTPDMISVTISATEHAVVCIHYVLVIDDIQKATAECMACWLYSVMF